MKRYNRSIGRCQADGVHEGHGFMCVGLGLWMDEIYYCIAVSAVFSAKYWINYKDAT